MREAVLRAVVRALGAPRYPAAVERFFVAFHDWRWAHLTLSGGLGMRARAWPRIHRIAHLVAIAL